MNKLMDPPPKKGRNARNYWYEKNLMHIIAEENHFAFFY